MSKSTREEILQILKEELRVEVDTKSVYTGGLDDSGTLYKDSHIVKVILGDEVISETYLD